LLTFFNVHSGIKGTATGNASTAESAKEKQKRSIFLDFFLNVILLLFAKASVSSMMIHSAVFLPTPKHAATIETKMRKSKMENSSSLKS
jgi:hypothetical protein